MSLHLKLSTPLSHQYLRWLVTLALLVLVLIVGIGHQTGTHSVLVDWRPRIKSASTGNIKHITEHSSFIRQDDRPALWNLSFILDAEGCSLNAILCMVLLSFIMLSFFMWSFTPSPFVWSKRWVGSCATSRRNRYPWSDICCRIRRGHVRIYSYVQCDKYNTPRIT